MSRVPSPHGRRNSLLRRPVPPFRLMSGIVKSVHVHFGKILTNYNQHVVDYVDPGRRGRPLPAAVMKLIYAPR